MEQFKRLIRDVPDFPKPGILFRDITPLLRDRQALHDLVEQFVARYATERIDAVVAIESRGFLLGAAVAYRLRAGLVPVRKRGKLPWKTLQAPCVLEYGEEVLEIHQDGLEAGARALLMDDVLATGGTMGATVHLVEQLKAKVVETAFLVELTPLAGRAKLAPHSVFSVVRY
ncbi:MAG: adenine phosphoribosyltransferase [Candidatus Omnitrophica bacterium]|nr:adenine phosphoribosyltransferase [Candidatus Omnitrophota bacterium]